MTQSTTRIAALALLWIMLARMLHAATLLSPVVDEQIYIARGLSVLQTGDLRLHIRTPVGLNLWEAAPLALDPTVKLPLAHESWSTAAWDRFSEQFLWRANANADGIVFRSRMMVMLLTLVLGAIVYRWASQLYGAPAGVVALGLYSLDPNILAHGMLATTDLGVTLFMFASTYALWYALRGGDGRGFVAAGALAGLALVSKYSGLFLIPVFVVLILVWMRRARLRGSSALRPALIAGGACLLVVLVTYSLRIDLYVDEFGFLVVGSQTHPAFLLGQHSLEGWWYYFFVTFFLKTPLPTLLLIGVAFVLSVRSRNSNLARDSEAARGSDAFLLIPSALYFLSFVVSGFNIGYRHLLPILPYLLVYASKITQTRHSSVIRPLSSVVYGVLIAWLALSSFTLHPDYLATFNELAPSPHYDVLVDSNLDWGQSLKQLRAYLDAHAIDRVKLSYFGTADPAAYGIDYDPLPRWPPPEETDFIPANPAPGVYAISASNLQGVLLDDPSAFDWFRRRVPDAIVGQSILIYHVAADPNPPQAVGLCRDPWTPIDAEKVDALFGRKGLRVVRFDCADAWWWPDVPVWYVVPPELEASPVDAVDFESRRIDDSLVYRVLRDDPPQHVARHPLEAPAHFDGGLTLLGFTWSGDWQAGQSGAVESVWRVDAPLSPPVSIFAHLLDPDGAFVADADGLGVPAELVQPGDFIVQRHRFDIPAGAPDAGLRVEFGFYRLDTLERYVVLVDGNPVGERVLAEPHK